MWQLTNLAKYNNKGDEDTIKDIVHLDIIPKITNFLKNKGKVRELTNEYLTNEIVYAIMCDIRYVDAIIETFQEKAEEHEIYLTSFINTEDQEHKIISLLFSYMSVHVELWIVEEDMFDKFAFWSEFISYSRIASYQISFDTLIELLVENSFIDAYNAFIELLEYGEEYRIENTVIVSKEDASQILKIFGGI